MGWQVRLNWNSFRLESWATISSFLKLQYEIKTFFDVKLYNNFLKHPGLSSTPGLRGLII